MRSLLSILLICLAPLLNAFEGIEPNSIYNDSVDVIMGNYVEHSIDLVTRGLEPLRVVRGVCGAADTLSSNHVIGWNMGSPYLFSYFKTHSRDQLGLQKMVVADLDGSMVLYRSHFDAGHLGSSHWKPVIDNGYCNTGLGEISGKTNLKNRTVRRQGEDNYCVTLGSGEEQIYQGPFKEGLCRLQSVLKPNGHRLEVEYDPDTEFIRNITAWNNDRSESLSSLRYTYSLPNRYTISSADGQSVSYWIDACGRLKRASGSSIRDITYTYETENLHRYRNTEGSHRITLVQQGNNYLENTYYKARENWLSSGKRVYLEGRTRKDHEVDHPAVGRICEQFAPVGPNGSRERVASYEYIFDWQKKWDPTTLAGRTEVLDAYNNRSVFHYSTHKQLTQIDRFQGSDERISSEYYIYADRGDDYGNLLGKVLCDDAPILATTLEYDERGNVVAERLWGDLTGESRAPLQLHRSYLPIDNGVDWWEKRFIYSEGNRLEVAIDGSKRTEYSYWGATDLEERRLVYADGRLVERTFCSYDKNGSLIESIRDNGTGQTADDLSNVTQRRMRRITPVASGVAIGLPQRVEEWYWENGDHFLGAIEFKYDNRSLVIAETVIDAANTPRYTLYSERDVAGRLTRQTDPLGYYTAYSYTRDNLVFEKTDQWVKHYSYDRADRCVAIDTRVQLGNISRSVQFRYDRMGNCIEVEEWLGGRIETEYDALGRPICQRSPKFGERRFGYNALGHKISETNALGEVTRRRYTARGDLVEELFPDGTSNRTIYNLRGLPICKISPDKVETHLTYDGMDRVVAMSILSPEGTLCRETLFRYEGDCLVYTRDGEGHERHYQYDGAGRLVAERCGESYREYRYDALGRPCCTAIALGSGEWREEWREYDLCNRVVEERIEDGQGRVLRRVGYAYDSAGNRTEVITGANQVERTEYDSFNRPVRIFDAHGNKTLIEYRVATMQQGRVAEKVVTDPLGGITITRTDGFGTELSVEKIDSFGVTLSHVEMVYDVAGRLTGQRTALINRDGHYATHLVSWVRGPMGRVERVDEGGRRSDFAYNRLGQLSAKILPSGDVIHYTYDGLGRLMEESGPGYRYQFSYDRNNNIVRVIDEQGREAVRHFDECNWITSERQSTGLTIDYTRDLAGRPTNVALPDGSSLFFRYDAAGMRALGREGGYEHLYEERDLSGRLLRERLIGDAGEVSRTWSRGLVASEGGGLTEKLCYDALGRVIECYANGDRRGFRYDGLSQLGTEVGNQLIERIFNSIGNLNRPDAAYNSQNELVGERYCHDGNGCLTASPNRTARFDGRGRLIEVSVDGKSYRYSYDAFDRRMDERCGDDLTLYLYDGDVEIAAIEEGRIRELRLLGEGIASDVGAIVAVELEGVPYAVRSDYRGSVAALIDLSGELFEEYSYTAFGEERFEGSSPWRFSSKRCDPTGLIYFGFRHYDPALGRWISPDPLGFAAGTNLYLYCGNDPINAIDPDGCFSRWNEFDYIPPREPFFDNKPLPRPPPRLPDGPPPKYQPERPIVHVEFESRYRGPPSRVFRVDEGKGSGKGRVMMVNGMLTGYQVAVDNSRMISAMSGVEVRGVWNATHGVWPDLRECFVGLHCYCATESVRLIQQEWNDFFEKAGLDELLYIICHSQGVIQVRNSLMDYDEELRKRIIVLAIAPAAYIDKHLCGGITHLVSDFDFITYLDLSGRIRCADTIIHVDRHPSAPLFFDHAFRSLSYRSYVKDWLKLRLTQ